MLWGIWEEKELRRLLEILGKECQQMKSLVSLSTKRWRKCSEKRLNIREVQWKKQNKSKGFVHMVIPPFSHRKSECAKQTAKAQHILCPWRTAKLIRLRLVTLQPFGTGLQIIEPASSQPGSELTLHIQSYNKATAMHILKTCCILWLTALPQNYIMWNCTWIHQQKICGHQICEL